MTAPLHDTALDQLFRQARTAHGFQPVPMDDEAIGRLYDLLKWGPTAFNAQPARFVFVRSPEAKAKLLPALSPGNRAQTQAAAATVIVAQDTRFAEHLPQLFPAYDAQAIFAANPALSQSTAFRNSSLQGAYLMLAARSLGWDVGPQSGFDAHLVNQTFFPDGRFEANFLVNLGVAEPGAVQPRGPRLAFSEAVLVL